MTLDLATRATGGYPADLRGAAGIKIVKQGLRADLSLDLLNVQQLGDAPVGGLVPVQDPVTGLVQALDFSKLPTSQPADGSVGNVKAAAMPAQTVKSNLLSATAQQQDVSVSDFGAAVGLGIARADIVGRTIPVRSFVVDGFDVVGDLGSGARYVRGAPSGLMAIQDAAGTWFNLSVPGEYNVGWFGAKGDGAADDGSAILKARDALPASGGTLYFPFTGKKYRILGQLVIGDGSADMQTPSTKQNVFLRGQLAIPGTTGQLSAGITNRDCVKISYEGAALIESAVKFAGPMTGGMVGLTIDGNFKTQFGLRLNAVFRSRFENLFIVNSYGTLRLDANGHAPVKTSIGASENLFVNVQGDSFFVDPAIPTVGFDIGYEQAFDGFALDVNRCTFIGCSVLNNENAGSSKLRLRGCDLVTFINCFGFQGGERNGAGIEVIAPVGQPHLPAEIALYNSPLYGRMRVATNPIDNATVWAPDSNGGFGIGLFPYALGDAINPSHAGAADLNLPYGFYGYDDRGNEFGFFPQQRKFFGGYGHDAPASIARSGYNAATNNTAELTLAQFTLLPRLMRARPQNLGAFTNAFAWDRKLKFELFGLYQNNTGAAQTVRFRIYIGTAIVFDTGGLSLVASANFKGWSAVAKVAATTSSSFARFAKLELFGDGSVGAAAGFLDSARTVGSVNDGVTVDFALAQQVRVTATLSAASPNLTFAMEDIDVEVA